MGVLHKEFCEKGVLLKGFLLQKEHCLKGELSIWGCTKGGCTNGKLSKWGHSVVLCTTQMSNDPEQTGYHSQ